MEGLPPKTTVAPVSVRQPSKRKRKGDGHWLRVSRACTHCRRLKIRCEEQRPCHNCVKLDQTCSVESPPRSNSSRPNVDFSARNQVSSSRQSNDGSLSVDQQTIDLTSLETQNDQDQPMTEFAGEQYPSNQQLNVSSPNNALSVRSGESDHTQASTSSILPILNESAEKRWGGESSYAASSEMLSDIEPLLKVSKSKIGLPGTDDQPNLKSTTKQSTYLAPSFCGFPDQNDCYRYLDWFFESVHCIFSFVQGGLCHQFFDEVYTNGVSEIDAANRGAHLAIIALGCQSSQSEELPTGNQLEARPSASERLYDTASSYISNVEKPSIPALALLEALSLYQMATGRYTAAWTTFGTCVRQAQAIGLHREIPNWRISKSLREGRRSTWINIYTLDTFFSMCYGRPPAIADEHCDVLLPSVYLDDINEASLAHVPETAKVFSIVQICEAAPSRMQFHLLKFHLCKIIRKLLGSLYLSPIHSPNALTHRQKWDDVQEVMEDLYELCACIPKHLRVADIDEREDKTYVQQAIFLDILINYTIILAYRPIMKSSDTETIPKAVASSRSNTSREASYSAAHGICTMVRYGREKKLGLTVQLILSAWGVYTSAAELIAMEAIQSSAGSREAREAYQGLSAILRHFALLKKNWPCNGKDHAILQGLVQVVRRKVIVESRAASPDPAVQGQNSSVIVGEANEVSHDTEDGGMCPPLSDQPSLPHKINDSSNTGPKVVLAGTTLDDLDLRWFDDFLASTKDLGVPDSSMDEQYMDLNDFDFSSWCFRDD